MRAAAARSQGEHRCRDPRRPASRTAAKLRPVDRRAPRAHVARARDGASPRSPTAGASLNYSIPFGSALPRNQGYESQQPELIHGLSPFPKILTVNLKTGTVPLLENVRPNPNPNNRVAWSASFSAAELVRSLDRSPRSIFGRKQIPCRLPLPFALMLARPNQLRMDDQQGLDDTVRRVAS